MTILYAVFKKSAVAAAGVTVASGGPVIEAAAGAFAEELLGEFLSAERRQLARMEELDHELQGQLLHANAGIDALRAGPIRAARLHVELAQSNPGERAHELLKARDDLFHAWGNAEGEHAQQAVVGQQLSVVYALLRDGPNAKLWSIRSYDASWQALDEQASGVQQEIDALLEQRPTLSKQARAHLHAMWWLTPDGALIVVTLGTILFVPAYRRRMKAIPSRQSKRVHDRLQKKRLAEAERDIKQKIHAVLELEHDAQELRIGCLDLGASQAEVPDRHVPLEEGQLRRRKRRFAR